MFTKFYKDPMLTIANHTKILAGFLVGSWLLAALIFCSLESQASVMDGLYWSMTTMSTVGYGDYSPHTTAGKVLAIAFQAWATFFLVPCVVANIIDRLREDHDKFTDDEQLIVMAQLSAIYNKLECK